MRAALERLRDDPRAEAVCGPLATLLDATNGVPSVGDLDRLLGPLAGVRFAPQPPKSRRRGPIDVATSYDGTIHERGVVPSREGSLHDVLNALVWASFPRTKRAIHARQYAVLRAHVPAGATQLPNARPRQADVLAMLDEGGVVLATDATWVERVERALVAGEVGALRTTPAYVLGHAVLEHLAEDRPGDPRASAYVVTADGVGAADAALAAQLADPRAFSAPAPWPAVPVRALFEGRIGLPATVDSVR